MPGDELLDAADGVSTRAIEIEAPPADVWPWLAQMGPGRRGGAYTYDWIENLLGLDMHSADRVLRDFQHPEIGDTIGFGSNQMRIERVEPEHVLSWRSQDGNWVWTFVLTELDGATRLISRNRFRLPTLAARIGMLPMEAGSLVMERRCCVGSRSAPSDSRPHRITQELNPRPDISGRRLGTSAVLAPTSASIRHIQGHLNPHTYAPAPPLASGSAPGGRDRKGPFRESGRCLPEGAQQAPCDRHRDAKYRGEYQKLREPVASDQREAGDHRREYDQDDADGAMEAARLRVRPRIERPRDLASAVGVGALALGGAGVAHRGTRPIVREALAVIGVDPTQLLPLRAHP